MSKIRIFSLGGLNENGKNMYVVEVNQDIFIFDAGLKYADDKLFGIDYILPNYDYVKENIIDIEKLLKMYDDEIPDDVYEKIINLIIKLELSLDMNVGLFREVCRLYEKENKLFNEGLTRIRVQ